MISRLQKLSIDCERFFFLIRKIWSRLELTRKRPYSTDYSYQSRYMNYMPEVGMILDIGSGHNPFPYATILSDRYVETSEHRTEKLVLDERPFVLLDIHHLPFQSKSIDYIYCSHILEHVTDPLQACSELMRVGKAGYIETPTLMRDALFSWAQEISHKWHIIGFGNRLVFFEYDERHRQGVRSTQWRDAILSTYYHPYQDIFYPNQDIFNTILEWKDRFDVTVFRLGQPDAVTLNTYTGVKP